MRRTKFWRPMSGLITNGMMSSSSGTRKSLAELICWGYLAIKSGFPTLFFTTGSVLDRKQQKNPSERLSPEFYEKLNFSLLMFHKMIWNDIPVSVLTIIPSGCSEVWPWWIITEVSSGRLQPSSGRPARSMWCTFPSMTRPVISNSAPGCTTGTRLVISPPPSPSPSLTRKINIDFS